MTKPPLDILTWLAQLNAGAPFEPVHNPATGECAIVNRHAQLAMRTQTRQQAVEIAESMNVWVGLIPLPVKGPCSPVIYRTAGDAVH